MADQSESIRVFVRVRPPFSSELAKDSVTVEGEDAVRLKYDRYDISCRYSRVFDKFASQDLVFSHITPLLLDALAGVNCSIFAYGQTSAGKTHTMLGPDGGADIRAAGDGSWGILPRSVFFLFDELHRRVLDDGAKYQVKLSYMQIYNEIIHDLLREKIVLDDLDDGEGAQSGLKIREYVEGSPDGGRKHEIFVSGLSEFRAETADDVLGLLLLGSSNRATRSTECNASSSRSHAILQLSFELEQQAADGQVVINRSKLSFVDLAGSEKILALGNDKDPKHLKELTSINKSLSSLGNVIAALSKGRPHVPYRDSKLTRLLQDSLGGNTRTLLIACVAPTAVHATETFNTLQFADRASSVMVRVRPNVVIDDKALLARAQVEVARLKRLLRFVMNGSGEKGPGAFSLESAGAGGLGTEHTNKQSAVLEAMALGAHAVRMGGGDDEAAAESEMIRLLDENERLRKNNLVLQQKCNRLQARLSFYQGNSSNAGVWSPAKGTIHKKTRRSHTGGPVKRRIHKSNPYIAHMARHDGDSDADAATNHSAAPRAQRGMSAGGLLESSDAASTLARQSIPSVILPSKESVRFDPSDPYGLKVELKLVPSEDADPINVKAEPSNLSPVRGVIRKKSKSKLSVAFSPSPIGLSTTDAARPMLSEAHSELVLDEATSASRASFTPQRLVGVRNKYATLAPVLRRAHSTTAKRMKPKQPKPDSDYLNANKQGDRKNRIDQIRRSAEWATAENELSAIERDLDARGKLLDCELQEDMTRLDDIQAEKVRLMQQLQEHLNRVDEHNQLDKESVMSPLGAPESGHVLKCENEVVAKHYDMPAAVPLNGFSGMVSPTTAGVCFDYFAGVLQTASTCTASPVQPVVHVSTSGTSNGSSFSSNVIAKAFSSSNSERAPQSMSKLSSPLKRVKNEPARLMNTELDVGRCLQMYSFRYDSWDNFDILDYNSESKLHKCLFHTDKSQQWLNLKKKPIRGFSLAVTDADSCEISSSTIPS